MNKKVLGLVALVLAIPMLTTLLVQAMPQHEKENENFLRFAVAGDTTYNLAAVPWIVVSPTISVKSVDEVVNTYVITVGDSTVGTRTYSVGADFTYKGHVTLTKDSSYSPPSTTMRIDYKYDFSDVKGGLKGEIKLVAMFVFGPGGETFIWSTNGTHDFKDVQIEATTTSPPPTGFTFAHLGIVSDWPDE